MVAFAYFVVIATYIICTSGEKGKPITEGQNITKFEKFAPGIYDEWNKTNPENVKGGGFAAAYGNDTLYVVSRRLYRKNGEDPWDPASRGGIVSSLHISTKTWTHKPYDRLDDDHYGDKIFTLQGHLFMLTYSTNESKVTYHKLFWWNDVSGTWVEVSIDIDPKASTESTNAVNDLSLNVPDYNTTVAYLVASAASSSSLGSEQAFATLEVQLDGSKPTKATIKSLARFRNRDPFRVVLTAVYENHVYGFVEYVGSDGAFAETGLAFSVDLKTKATGNVTLAGTPPPGGYSGGVFQTPWQLFLVGGNRPAGLGHYETVKDIWSLDFNSDPFKWSGTNATYPDGVAGTFAYDYLNANLYSIDLSKGVSVAKARSIVWINFVID